MGEGFRRVSTRPSEGRLGQGDAVQEGGHPDPTLKIFVIKVSKPGKKRLKQRLDIEICFRAASIFVQFSLATGFVRLEWAISANCCCY